MVSNILNEENEIKNLREKQAFRYKTIQYIFSFKAQVKLADDNLLNIVC